MLKANRKNPFFIQEKPCFFIRFVLVYSPAKTEIMRNLFFVLFATLLFFGCKKDDDTEPTEILWRISIQQDCPGGSEATYCASEQQWDRVDGMIVVGEPCNWVSFTDINGTSRSGYFRSASSGGSGCD